jgi:aspartyl-tRNA(Asn)/glutamyl-tRNA(Gln) amidotransferase subunit A
MVELTHLTIAEARDGLAGGVFSATELTEAHNTAIEAARPLNAMVLETADRARDMAARSDLRLAKGEGGMLEGIPLAIKDLFCTEGVRTTAGSHILDNFVPPYESTVTANLWRAGAVMLGKTNMDEFAMGSSNETSFFGPVENPWRKPGDNRPIVPGGSSGGSASIVAARAALAATGTDTGGSIRQPASFTGLVGLKPTYGRCSRWGIIAFASSLDQAGPLTRSVRDAAIMLSAMSGHDPKDSTSADLPVPDFEAALSGDIKGLRIGIPSEYRMDGLPEEIEKLWQQGIRWLEEAGAETREVSLPHTKYALPAYYIVAPAEASSNLARYDGVRYGLRVEGDDLTDMYERTRAEGFGAEVKRRVMIGTYVLSAGYYDAYYVQAQKIRTLIARDFQSAFDDVDVLLTPTAPSEAFAVGDKSDDPIAMYFNDVFTVPASMAGLPGVSVPSGLSETGLPLGLQLIGKAFDEETIVRTAGVLEAAAAFDAQPEAWWETGQ